ncbi:MAG: FHA domain-containing protein [Actinomycetota bacterium]|nr:FHA domain-containing protein [Actinomycetota bacterium]
MSSETPENLSAEAREALEGSRAAAACSPEQTLHLERSAFEAATAPPAAAPPVTPEAFQPAMVGEPFQEVPRTASVMVRSGPDTGARFALDRSPLYVGRAPDNGIVVHDPATSRRHARFELRGTDFLVVDLGSANGTLLENVRLVEQVLADGMVITMGQNEFVVSISQPDALLKDVEEEQGGEGRRDPV